MLKKPRGEQVVFGRGGSLMQVGQASWNRLHRWAAEGRPHTAEGSSTLEHTQKQSLGQTVSCSGSSPDRESTAHVNTCYHTSVLHYTEGDNDDTDI